ncbi:hypothetical protein Tco_1217809 [Tanacetum coccineum]
MSPCPNSGDSRVKEVGVLLSVSVRGCRVEIQGNNEAVGGEQKDYNTLRSCNMSGGCTKRMKIPLPLGGLEKKTRMLPRGGGLAANDYVRGTVHRMQD